MTVCFVLANSCGNIQEKKAAEIHAKVLTVDTHVDTPFVMSIVPDYDLGEDHDFNESAVQVDFPRMKEGGLDAVFFAVFVGQGPLTPSGYTSAQESAREQFDVIHESIEKNADLAALALSPQDAYNLEEQGRRAIFIGMENGYPIGEDLTRIQEYYDSGARYITLCHIENNHICDSSDDSAGAEHGGLSEFGRQVVAEMNRIGMMVDVSHVSDEAFYDVVEMSISPVIASHSNARAVCDHPRNMDDSMLRALAENGGVINVTLFTDYVKAYDRKDPQDMPTVADLVDHIDHIAEVTGIDHVGIGSDFDGGGLVEGCSDVSEIGSITLELVKRGYNEGQIQKIWGGNMVRVFENVIVEKESKYN